MQGPRSPAHDANSIASFLAAEGVGLGARILDVPCGIGRRAFALAEEGFDVTAIDTNEIALAEARSRTPASLASRLRFVASPRDSVPGLEADVLFDAILSLEHPLGRAGPSEDETFLARLATHVPESGLMVLELLHRDFFASRPKPFSFHVIGELEQHEFRTFEPVAGALELTWKFYAREGEHLRHRGGASARMVLPTPHEVGRLLEKAGWRLAAAYGGWGREAVRADRRKLVLVARLARA